MKNEKIIIPDEFIPDYSTADKDMETQENEYREKVKAAFEKLEIEK